MTDISLEQLLENIFIFGEGTADQFPNAQAQFSSLSAMDPAEEAQLIQWLTILYASATMRAVWARLLANEGKIFFGKVDFSSDPALSEGGGAFGSGRFIGIDFDEISQARWFNGVGEVVQGKPEILLAHEFGHLEDPINGLDAMGLEALLGIDPDAILNGEESYGPDQDFDGPAVRLQNRVAQELDRGVAEERRSYAITWAGSDSFFSFFIATRLERSLGHARRPPGR